MIRCATLTILFLLLASSLSLIFPALRDTVSGAPSSPQESSDDKNTIVVAVKVVYQNDHPAGEGIVVRFESLSGGTPCERVTDGTGEVTCTIGSGAYIVRVSGAQIKATTSGILDFPSYASFRQEFVRVEPLNSVKTPPSTQKVLSAAELNTPAKARKEFDKGDEALAKADRDAALQHYQKAVDLYPTYAIAYNNIGAIYMESNDTDRALQAWNNALRADPNLPAANANLARIKLAQHSFCEAIPLLEKALTREPNNPDFCFLMSEAQLFSGSFDQALLYARKVKSVPHQKFEYVHVVAGLALQAQNRLDEARSEYDTLLRESPAGPEAAEARKSIAQLDSLEKRRDAGKNQFVRSQH